MSRVAVLLALAALVAVVATAVPATGAESSTGSRCVPDPGDEDCDGVRTDGQGPMDNCPTVRNADQVNTDGAYTETDPRAADGATEPMRRGDPQGDACDADDDADGVADLADLDGDGRVDDRLDNCRTHRNPRQLDANGNGYGEDESGADLCTVDTDRDGVFDEQDNCPNAVNPDQSDLDQDGRGDVCDGDDDADGVPDSQDNCPTVANEEQTDRDGDGIGTACDPGEVASTPTPTPTPAVSDRAAPSLSLLLARRLPAGDLAGRLPVTVRCDEACSLRGTLTLSRAGARAKRLPRALARGRAFLGDRGETYLFLKARRSTIRRLQRVPGGRVRARLRVRAVDPAGNRRIARRSITLRRGS